MKNLSIFLTLTALTYFSFSNAMKSDEYIQYNVCQLIAVKPLTVELLLQARINETQLHTIFNDFSEWKGKKIENFMSILEEVKNNSTLYSFLTPNKKAIILFVAKVTQNKSDGDNQSFPLTVTSSSEKDYLLTTLYGYYYKKILKK